jgi:hypothetical protein
MLEAEWRQVLLGSVSTGTKENKVKYSARLGCLISPCDGPFSLGPCFEIYEPFIYLILQFFLGRGDPRITDCPNALFDAFAVSLP